MTRWLRVGSTDDDFLLLASAVITVKRQGNRVIFGLVNGSTYDWQWDGKTVTFAKLLAALGLSDAV